MSNSRKRIPIVGMTTAPSDKTFKQAEHQRERVAARIALNKGIEPRSPRAFGDPAKSEKDGKQYRPDYDRALRK